MSPLPTPDNVEKLRNSSSSQRRACSGSTALPKLSKYQDWHTVYAYAEPQATSVNVAPDAYTSSVAIIWSRSM